MEAVIFRVMRRGDFAVRNYCICPPIPPLHRGKARLYAGIVFDAALSLARCNVMYVRSVSLSTIRAWLDLRRPGC